MQAQLRAPLPPATMTLEVDFPGQAAPHTTLTISQDGNGRYSAPTDAGPAATVFHLPPATVAPWFNLARAMHYFQEKGFQSKRKVAFTGTKTLSYQGFEGAGTTTFTYTEDTRLTDLLGQLQQLSQTLQLGLRLEADLRFNRMALDGDMTALQSALKDKLAGYPEAIAPTLQKLADSPDAIDRVRRQAGALLKQHGAP
jgi:hypothetical protein